MKQLPDKPDIEQLKRQAKELIAAFRMGASTAFERFRRSLPAAADLDDATIATMTFKLHDAQSCLAREYGFQSWAELSQNIETRRLAVSGPADLASRLLSVIYAGDIAGGMNNARPQIARDLLKEYSHLIGDNPYVACAVGNVDTVQRQIQVDPSWIDRAGGPFMLPPLVAVAHSSLFHVAEFREQLLEAASILLKAGADPNQSVGSRWPPASLNNPSSEYQLSALYGAAGKSFDLKLTRLLLEAGADPNDGESLYHSLENPVCTKLLLDAGAVVTGTNALLRVLDFDDLGTLRLLLSYAGSSDELDNGTTLFWAIRRRRSPAHIKALLDAGVDASARTNDGVSTYTLASYHGMTEVAQILSDAGAAAALSEEERFIAACTRLDQTVAEQIQSVRPDLPKGLADHQLRLLAELAAEGCSDVVKVMVQLGWPINIRGGDWHASALNHAVFRGEAELTRYLLERGATWTETHGFDDNVCGTLSWASINRPVEGGDWAGCAEALIENGMPAAYEDPTARDGVIVAGQKRHFSDEVADILLAAGKVR